MPRAIRRTGMLAVLAANAALSGPVVAHESASNTEITVTGRAESLVGISTSASLGRVGQVELATRPILRSGELLEVIPGAAVTQHSGTGKANQYYLRGFNLDHGTDFAGFLDGVPLNMLTHGHGQGYLDLNPIIPELVELIDFGKGPYYTDVGNFSSAGYARYQLASELDRSILKFTGGENDFYRAVGAHTLDVGDGHLTGAVEAQYGNGPWVLDEEAHKFNGYLGYTGAIGDAEYTLSALAYDADWNSTDQVPRRAVQQGLISPLGNIDPTLGGNSTRYSLNAQLRAEGDNRRFRANAYGVYSDFNLISNFTYFLDDPVLGDQFIQQDRRLIAGFNSAFEFDHALFGASATTTIGAQLRHDDVQDVALLRSRERIPVGTVRSDEASETALGIYASSEIRWTPWLRTTLGLRADQYWFDVTSNLPVNTGDESDNVFSPKLAVVLGPWRSSELYLNVGRAFHSNDARGTVTVIDPASGDPAAPVDPLVQSLGGEFGLRTTALEGLQTTFSVWYLELDSELLFVGDAGTTEPSGESRRYGVEISNYYRPTSWLTLDLDIALTESEFSDEIDDEIPNSVGRVITAGAAIDLPSGLFGTLRMRHFGDVPLNEDGSVEAGDTTVVNLRAGYRVNDDVELAVDVFNLFDSDDADISYFFGSCLPSDPPALCGAGLAERPGVEDVHLHPVETRQVRATLTWRF